jgi:hypothetical protein
VVGKRDINLESRLVLHAWVNELFGYGDMREMLYANGSQKVVFVEPHGTRNDDPRPPTGSVISTWI